MFTVLTVQRFTIQNQKNSTTLQCANMSILSTIIMTNKNPNGAQL